MRMGINIMHPFGRERRVRRRFGVRRLRLRMVVQIVGRNRNGMVGMLLLKLPLIFVVPDASDRLLSLLAFLKRPAHLFEH